MQAVFRTLVLLLATGCSCEEIPEGTVGLVDIYGEVKSVEPPGMFVEGLTENVTLLSVRLETEAIEASAASRDMQKVTAKIAVPYTLTDTKDSVLGFRRAFESHKGFVSRVLNPGTQESVKAVTAQYSAEELISKRNEVTNNIKIQLSNYVQKALVEKKLEGVIVLGQVALTDFDFGTEYNQSIEQKQKAEQDAQRAKNEKNKRITEAEAAAEEAKLKADAEAHAITARSKAKSEAIKREAEALRGNPDLVRLRAIEKWNGELPVYSMPNATPFIKVE